MRKVHWLCAGLSLLAAAAPAVAQRGQYDDRDSRDARYDQNDRDRGDSRYDRDDRSRGDRGRDRDRDDRRGNGRPGADRSPPGGSWAQSCRRSSMSGNRLTAQCKDERGKWRDTQISPRSCQSGRLGNRSGALVCE